MRGLIEAYRPDDVAFEELFFARNVKTALMIGAARGVAIAAAAEYTENLYEYTPMQIKQAVAGYGRAEKAQVQQMVKLLLGMSELPRPDDAADGIAVAVTHAHAGRAKEQFLLK
jgi:crossover junction endodeoxyribonuclease RuvC